MDTGNSADTSSTLWIPGGTGTGSEMYCLFTNTSGQYKCQQQVGTYKITKTVCQQSLLTGIKAVSQNSNEFLDKCCFSSNSIALRSICNEIGDSIVFGKQKYFCVARRTCQKHELAQISVARMWQKTRKKSCSMHFLNVLFGWAVCRAHPPRYDSLPQIHNILLRMRGITRQWWENGDRRIRCKLKISPFQFIIFELSLTCSRWLISLQLETPPKRQYYHQITFHLLE